MEYREFVERVKQSVQEQAGEQVRVDVSSIWKNNLDPMDGLTILHRGENVARAIWLNPLYCHCESGMPIHRIAEEILAYNERNRQQTVCDVSFYTDFAQVKNQIVCKLIHFQMNEALLQEIPHRRFFDLAVVYYYRVEQESFENASILVKNAHLQMWKTDLQTLDQLAVQNTLRLLPYEFLNLMELIAQMTGDDADLLPDQEIPMYVLTNQEKYFGASMLLFPEVLDAVAGRLDNDFFVLPSSIHECIVIPALDGVLPEELHAMVKEVNTEHVAPEELLGDSVYRYDRSAHRLRLAFAGSGKLP